jgi:raffinose/stachyose/melibiose transport system permease protein
MTRGGPNHATEMPATLLYSQAFVYRNFGQGNAIGVVILALGLALSIVLNRLLNQET